ncbi:MAG: protein translocase subunit SecD [Gemmatimonadetes bacterium]|nr:protein translocase subunit SecD [Gemmatimonadota bacterium]
MPANIRNRLIIIAGLVVLSVAPPPISLLGIGLWPRDVTVRTRGADGRMRDTVIERVPLKQGLDLQGGIHLALEVDESQGPVENRVDALDRALRVIRTRIDEFGVAEPLVQRVGDERIVVELPGLRDPGRAKEIVQRSAFLEFRIVDMRRQFQDALTGMDAALRRAGVRASGPSPVAQLLGADTTSTGAAGSDSLAIGSAGALSSLLYPGDQPGEFLVREQDYPHVDSLLNHPEVRRLIPRGLETLWSVEVVSQGAQSFRPLYAVQQDPIITGEYLADAQAQIDQLYNQAVVNFQLTRAGGRIFMRETSRHVQDYMAIVLDGRVQGDPPVIRTQIGQRGQIELGSASLQQAQDLALVLRAGALPTPLQIVEERAVGPSLGRDSIDKGKRAVIIGTLGVVLLVAGYYRFAGLLAIAALSFYVLFTLGGLASFGATLTLPGLAGFALSIGMAVDANVLVFERIREELAQNKTVRAAVDAGFLHAMPAIVDSNLTTVLTALFLFQFGTGPVKGFAVTLIVGIIASFLSAVFVTRTFFLLWIQRRAAAKELPI